MQYGPTETSNRPAVIEQPQTTTAQTTTTQTSEIETQPTEQTNQSVALEHLWDRFQSPNTLLVFGVLLMVIMMFRLLRKKHKANAKRANAQSSPADRIANIHTQAQSSMEPSRRVMVDAEEMARRLGATLDNKAARLELLIEEADQKLATLNRTLATSTPTQPTQPPPPTNPTRTIDPTLLDRARLEQDHAERQSRVAGRIEPTIQEPKPDQAPQLAPQPEPQTIQSQVFTLADSGHTSTEIAHQLNQPVGQVELILNLRKQQG